MAGPTWQSWPRRFENCYANIARVQRGEKPEWVLPELADLPRTYLSTYDPSAPLEFTVTASVELILNVE